MKIKTLILLIFISVGLLNAQDVDQEIKKLQDKFKTVENFEADFNQSTIRNTESNPIVMKGKFAFLKENNFKIEFLNQHIISDGVTIWNYNKKMSRVVISSYEDEPNAFSVQSFVMDYPSKCKIELVENNKIKMNPVDEEVEFNEAVISYDSNYIITQIEVVDFSETKYIVDLYNIELNKNIKKEEFNFIPPEGTQIVDLR